MDESQTIRNPLGQIGNLCKASASVAGKQVPVRLKERPLLNRWLWAITFVGGAIVLFGGLARDFRIPEDISALTYEASGSTMVFAAVMLPLCLLYAFRSRTSVHEGVFLWFALGTVTYTKDFAYLRVPGAPIFVTDVVLGWLLLRLFVWPRRRWVSSRSWIMKFLFAFSAAGAVAAFRGAFSGQSLLLIFRDSAIVVYALFLLVGAYIVRDWAGVRRFLLFGALGAGLSTLHALAWFVAQPGQRRYIGFGVYVLTALAGTLVLLINRRISSGWGWMMVALFACGLLLANARTLFVALAVLLGIAFLVGPLAQRKVHFARWKLVGATAVAAALVFAIALRTQAGATFVERATEELISGTVGYSDDANAEFRLLAWAEALSRFAARPLIGEGYGAPFTFERTESDVRPHNTFLTVLYKMGLLGFLPLFFLLAWFHWAGWRTLHRLRQQSHTIFLYVVLIAHLGMCIFGILNLLLESPFLAALFWSLLGVGLRIRQMLAADNAIRGAAMAKAA